MGESGRVWSMSACHGSGQSRVRARCGADEERAPGPYLSLCVEAIDQRRLLLFVFNSQRVSCRESLSETSAHLAMSGASLGGLDPASLDPASLGGLDPAGWKRNEKGEIKNGEPQCKEDDEVARFVHSQSLEAEDVWRMKMLAGGNAVVGR